MKKFLQSILIIVFAFSSIQSFSQTSSITWIGGDGLASPIRLRFQLGEYTIKSVSTPRGAESIVVASGASPILRAGAPDLPKFTGSVIIPDLASYQVEIISSHTIEIANQTIAPSKGNLKRDINPSTISRNRGEVYQTNNLFPEHLASLRNPYIFSEFRGQTVIFYPFQYNHQSHTLHVTDQIEVVLRPLEQVSPQNPFVRNLQVHSDINKTDLYSKHFLNYSVDRYSPILEQPRMLIISDPAFVADLEPLITWKRQTGMDVEVLTLAQAGGNAAGISSAVQTRYHGQGLSYLLLVGDIAQIPSLSAFTGKSDPSYGFIDGNDTYPEVIVGRLSAENTTHVQTQVSKIVQYEKALLPVSNLCHLLAMASDQGPGDDNELDWEHERVMRNKLTSYTYNLAYELYDGSEGELDQAGNPSAANVTSTLNQGVGLLNYTGHGSATSFGTSGFSNTQINQLQNNGMLPFVWSVGCVNGEFDNGTCFGESWLRATSNGQLTGAVATYMSSINQSWDPPMSAQDEMVDLLTGLVQTTNTRTFGGLCLNGCLQMNDEYGTAGDEMTATWHIFGDPSMMVRTAVPTSMVVTHAATTALGTNGFLVNVDVEDARVGITQNGVLLGTALVSSGQAWVNFSPLTLTDPLLITVTAFNHIPYQGNVTIESPSDAFLLLSNHQLNEVSGNGDQLADYAETLQINASIENVGGSEATDVSGTITTSDAYITILNPNCQFGNVAAGLTALSDGCFTFQVDNNIVDQSIAHFILTFTDNSGNSWSQPLTVTLNAPVLQIPTISFSEITGNGNGQPDAGESLEIVFSNQNDGHAATLIGIGTVTVNASEISLPQSDISISSLNSSNQETSSFTLNIQSTVSAGSYVPVQYTWTAGSYSVSKNTLLHVGAVIEDVETGDFSHFNWQNADQTPWTIDNATVYEGTNSFKSGAIGNSETTQLIIQYNVSTADTLRFMKKVSTEEGYDYLKFYLDGQPIQTWSGLIDWSQEKVIVSAGIHEFSWIYEKDDMVSGNEDACWIDYIVFPAGNSVSPSGIQQTSNVTESFNVFPNPIQQGVFTLTGNQIQQGVYTFRMLDASGRCIENRKEKSGLSSNQWKWDISQYAAGFYFLEIRKPDNQIQTIKLMLE